MARKVKKHQIDKKMVIDAFAEMAKEKNIDKDLLQGIVEETLSLIVKKKYGNHAEFEIVVNMDKGDLEIYLIKQVVEEVIDPETEISVKEANLFSEEPLKIGDDFIEEITLDNISDSFGRRLVSFASQTMNQKIRDVERDNIYNEYVAKQGELIVGEVYQVRRNMILVMHGNAELKLLKEDQIPSDFFMLRKNGQVKALVKEVKKHPGGGMPEILLTRASGDFIAKLIEQEVPEVYDGIIQIKAIAREAGERTKVALTSIDSRVEPIGACIGMKGIRINAVSREIGRETIDFVLWVENPLEMIEKALSPAKVKEITISEATKTATVLVPEDQVSNAIGKNGQNVRLASLLTGYAIKLLKEGGEDIEIQEFETEFGTELIEKLKEADIFTARDFIEAEPEELLAIDGMNYELIIEGRRIMLLEFDEIEDPEYITQLRIIAGIYETTVENDANDNDANSSENNSNNNDDNINSNENNMNSDENNDTNNNENKDSNSSENNSNSNE